MTETKDSEGASAGTLPVAPTKATLDQLIRIKLFLEHAVGHSCGDSIVDRMVAIHGFDNCIEYTLRVLVPHLDIEARANKNFDSCELASLAAEINKFLREHYNFSLPYLSEIKSLRSMRNLVQHAGADPNPEIQKTREMVDRFFSKVISGVFGLDPSDLRSWALVKDKTIRACLNEADEHLKSKEYLESVICARDAFENAYFIKTRNLGFNLHAVPKIIDESRKGNRSMSFTDRLLKEINLLSTGVNVEKFRRFEEYLNFIPYKYFVEEIGNRVLGRDWSRADALFCLNFASDTATGWELSESAPIETGDSDLLETARAAPVSKNLLGPLDLDADDIEDGCIYVLEGERRIQLLYLGKQSHEMFERLEVGEKYDEVTQRFQNGKMVSETVAEIEILGLDLMVVTNRPPRWRGIIHYLQGEQKTRPVLEENSKSD